MANTDLCQGTAEVADLLTYGDVITIYRSAQDFGKSKCVLLVGTNPPVSSGGQWVDIMHAKRNGAKLIVVDPRRTEAAHQADLCLQIRPGTTLRTKALVIHEDPDVRKKVKQVLEPEGWHIDLTTSHADGLDYFNVHPCPDLVLLGLSASITNNMETLTAIHQNAVVPIIIMAAQECEDECLYALEQGAADYILRPIKANTLVARVRIVMRNKQRVDWQNHHLVYDYGYLTIDLNQGEVSVRGRPARLTAIEYRLRPNHHTGCRWSLWAWPLPSSSR